MDSAFRGLFAALFFYLLGALPFSYWIVRLAKGVDIRQLGSGNPGATNVTRKAGWTYGMAAFVLDLSKGALAAYLAAQWALPLWLAGFAVIGHNWSCWLKFQGGKGVATTLGVILLVSWLALLITIGVWLVIVAASRRVSLASMIALLLSPLALLALGAPLEYLLFTAGLGLMAVWRHQENIARLIKGEEPAVLRSSRPSS